MPAGSAQPVASITIEIKDDHNFAKKLGPEFHAAVSAVLSHAGYAGSFQARAAGLEVGSPHTKGLRVGTPAGNAGIRAVNVTWQGGDNGSRVALLLTAPQGVDPGVFRERLVVAKKEFDALPPAPKLKVVPTPPPSSPQLPPTEPDMPAVQDAAPSADVTEQEAPAGEIAKIKFADDPERVELFYHYILVHVTDEGLVASAVCTEALRTHFGVQKMGTGAVLRSLCGAKHLRAVSDSGFYRLPKPVLKRLRPAVRLPAADTADGAVPPEAEKPAVQRRIKQVKQSELIGKLDELERQAGQIPLLEAEMGDIDKKIAGLNEQIAKLEERKPKALQELAICQEAKATLEKINATLAGLSQED